MGEVWSYLGGVVWDLVPALALFWGTNGVCEKGLLCITRSFFLVVGG